MVVSYGLKQRQMGKGHYLYLLYQQEYAIVKSLKFLTIKAQILCNRTLLHGGHYSRPTSLKRSLNPTTTLK